MTSIYEPDKIAGNALKYPPFHPQPSMAADPPPPYEAAPPYQQTPPSGAVTLASQAQILEQILGSTESTPRNPTTTKNYNHFKSRYWYNYFVSLVVFAIYLMVVIGCSASGLKSLYLVRFDNLNGLILVKNNTYAATARPLKRDVTSAVAEPWSTRSTVSASGTTSASDAFATVTGISASGNRVATTPSATLTGSTTRSSFRSATAYWYTRSTTLATSVRAATTTSYYTEPEALYLPTTLGNYTSYMGYFGTIEGARYRGMWALGVPYDYYVSIWFYGYFDNGYKAKKNTIYSGIDYSKMVNSNAKVWIYMLGLNFKEDGFLEKSNLNRINNIAKALQPMSVILMALLLLYVGMSLHILPRKWTPYIASASIGCSFVFSVLCSVVAKQYAYYISTAFSLEEITVKKGSQTVTLVWVAFGFQCVFCFVELTLYNCDI